MGIDLIATDAVLSLFQAALARLVAIVAWMGGVLVALTALTVVLYTGLLWGQRAGRTPGRRPAPTGVRRHS